MRTETALTDWIMEENSKFIETSNIILITQLFDVPNTQRQGYIMLILYKVTKRSDKKKKLAQVI